MITFPRKLIAVLHIYVRVHRAKRAMKAYPAQSVAGTKQRTNYVIYFSCNFTGIFLVLLNILHIGPPWLDLYAEFFSTREKHD